jgi:hypothetical protein
MMAALKACIDKLPGFYYYPSSPLLMRGGILFFLLSLFFTVPCYGEQVSLLYSVHNTSFSEPNSISTTILDNWKGDFNRGEQQWFCNWFEIGIQWKQLSLSYLQRYDYDLRFSGDTAFIQGLTKNKINLPVGQTYDLFIETHFFKARGIRTACQVSFFNNFQTTIGFSYLEADYLMEGKLEGQLTVISGKDYNYQANVNYQYSEDVLFDRQIDTPPRGRGFSLDLDTRFEFSKWNARLRITDLFARIFWKNLPYTVAIAGSNNKNYDSDGYVEIIPALTGYEKNHEHYTQKISPRWLVDLNYCPGAVSSFFLEAHSQYDFLLLALGSSITSNHGTFSLKLYPKQRGIGLGYNKNNFSFNLISDSLKKDEIKLFALNISYGFI